MKNKRYPENTPSQNSKSLFVLRQKKDMSFQTIHQEKQSEISRQKTSDLDDFFDKFHDTFIVLEKKPKTKSATNKIKKTPDANLATQKISLQVLQRKFFAKEIKKPDNPNQQRKITKQKIIREILNKTHKTCQSDKNILKSLNNNQMQTRKISEKKSEACSKKKSTNRKSKRSTIKKNILGTGSTATTTLGNSSIKLKQDIKIASYVRVKIKGT